MISEPEMVGGFEPGVPAETVSGFDRKPVSGRRRYRHGLLRGAVGALVASAVWAGAVFVYGVGDGKPDLRGYRMGERPCTAMKLTALSKAVGKMKGRPSSYPGRVEHPALDRVDCFVALIPVDASAKNDAEGWSVQLDVSMRVELHKETDPRPEFEAVSTTADFYGNEVVDVQKVPGLGESAYLLTVDEGSSQLSVLDGGAVITLRMSVSTMYDGEGPPGTGAPDSPEATSYQGDLISDAGRVMDALRE